MFQFLCHIQRFNKWTWTREKKGCFVVWSCNTGMKKYLLSFEATWGQQRAAQCETQIFLLLSEAVIERKPSGGRIQRSDRHLSWVCKVKFFKTMLFKTCLHDETKEKNAKFTMQERTCWRLCTIVILLMCKYMPMFGMLLLFICCKWREKNINHKAIRLPSCPLTLRTAEVTSFLKLGFTMSKFYWKMNKL